MIRLTKNGPIKCHLILLTLSTTIHDIVFSDGIVYTDAEKYLYFFIFTLLLLCSRRWGCSCVGRSFSTIEQYASAANKGFLLLLFCVCTGSPPDLQIFVNKVNVTNTTVGHSKRLPQVLLA